jgi:hypothetical protein
VKKRQHAARIFGSIALAPPAARMVVVWAWTWHDETRGLETGHEICAVLAIRAAVVLDFSREVTDGQASPYPEATPAAMEEQGWSYEGQDIVQEPLIWDSDCEALRSPEEVFGGTSNVAHEVVVCTWPPEEDGSRLIGSIELVRRKAEERRAKIQDGTNAVGS